MDEAAHGGARIAPLLILLGLACAGTAQAVPLYAQHNGFPELTPYGRLFKLNGYTFKGGD